MKKICFIIPCYGSENTLAKVINDIRLAIRERYTYRIILVSDCSPDNVFLVIKQLCKEDKNIIGLQLARNFGQQAARMAALNYLDGEYVIFMDDDGQHPSEGIISLVEKLEEGYDIVYAKFRQKKESRFKRFGSWLNTKMTDLLLDKPKHIKQSSFFAMRYFVAKGLLGYNSPFPYLFGYLMKITRKIANVELEHNNRIAGNSGYNLKKLVSLWFNGVLGFSIVPLRIATVTGILFAVCGFLWGIYLIIRKIMMPEILVGYTSFMAVILLIGGVIMIMLGIIGEYVGRIFLTLTNVPQYIISEKINDEEFD